MTDVLKYWTTTGVGGSKIEAYTTLEPGNNVELRAGIYLMGGVYIGLQMPITANAQTKHNGTWSLVPGYQTNPDAKPGSWGGHAIPLIGYNSQSLVTISWGMPINITWGFLNYYADEFYAPLSSEWVSAGNVAPNHFDLAQLQADMHAL